MKKLITIIALLPFFASAQIGLGSLITVENKDAKASASKWYNVAWLQDSKGIYYPIAATDKVLQDAKLLALKNPEDVPDLLISKGGTSLDLINYSGYIDVRSIGLVSDYNPGIGEDKWTDCSAKLQKYIDSLPQYSMAHLYFPHGNYFFKKEVKISNNKGIDIIGDKQMPYSVYPTVATTFFFGLWHQACNGFNITGDALPSMLSDVRLIGNAIPIDRVSGIYHENIISLERVYVQAFTYGFYTNISAPFGNSSLSYYQSCRASANLIDGFFAGGPDANVISYINCVSIQNHGAGFHDATMFGCYYAGCQTATNGRGGDENQEATTGGGWIIEQPGSRSVVNGCYSEKDQLPNYINPLADGVAVIGGTHDNDWCGNLPGEAYAEPGGDIGQGSNHSKVVSKYLKGNKLNIAGLDVQQTQEYGQPAKISFKSGNDHYLDIVYPNTPFAPASDDNLNLPDGKISVPFPTVALPKNYWIGNKLVVTGTPDIKDIPFQRGWKIIPSDEYYDGPEYWKCITPGRNGASDKLFTSVEPIGNFGGSQDRQFAILQKGDYHLLKVGDHLKFSNDAIGKITTIDTEILLEVINPANIHVHVGDKVNWFGGIDEYFNPAGYTDNSLIIRYTPSTKIYNAGDEDYIDEQKTTIKSVTIEKGVQLVTFNFPKTADVEWFKSRPGAPTNVSLGKEKIVRTPYNIDRTNPSAPEVTIAFPMANIQAGAYVQVDNTICFVKRVATPGISIQAIEGRVWGQQSFKIQSPVFESH